MRQLEQQQNLLWNIREYDMKMQTAVTNKSPI